MQFITPVLVILLHFVPRLAARVFCSFQFELLRQSFLRVVLRILPLLFLVGLIIFSARTK